MPPTKKPAYTAFAANLRNAMNRKGYNQAALVSQAGLYTPKSHPISRSNVHEYVAGKKLPGPVRLEAIARALDVEVSDLVPITTPRTRSAVPTASLASFEMIDAGNGMARIVFDRVMPMQKAMEVMGILNSIDKPKRDK